MDNDLRNNIKLYNDVLALRSTNFCRLEHIVNPVQKVNWDKKRRTGDYMFPCHKCKLRVGDTCSMPRLDLKVK
jgi:hypothetical protein